MNKIVLKLLFVLLCLNLYPLIADEFDTSLEFRSAAFFHSSKRFREIYGNVSGSYQLEASTKFNECFDTFVNFDWFSKHGKSKGFNDPTKVSIASISLGPKFLYPFKNCFTAYIGIGPSFAKIWLKNRPKHRHERTSKLSVGGLLKTGVYYFVNRQLFLDLFVDYLYQPVHFHTHVDIGGVKTGLGIGYKF